MNVITIEDKAYNNILDKIDNLEKSFSDIVKKSKNPLKDKWLDNQEVMELLKCSKKYLQNLRTEKTLKFSVIKQKIYYKAVDIDFYLESHYDNEDNEKGGTK